MRKCRSFDTYGIPLVGKQYEIELIAVSRHDSYAHTHKQPILVKQQHIIYN